MELVPLLGPWIGQGKETYRLTWGKTDYSQLHYNTDLAKRQLPRRLPRPQNLLTRADRGLAGIDPDYTTRRVPHNTQSLWQFANR